MPIPTLQYPGERPEMLKYIPNESKRILEVGCGGGGFAVQLLSDRREVWAVEPDPEAAQIVVSRKLHRVLNHKIEDCSHMLPDDYFDVIICNDVLEHLYDPWRALRLLRPKLSQNGKLIASIPNFRYVTNLYQIVVQKDWRYEKAGILDATHIRFFTRKSIESLFSTCGYRILQLDGITRTKSLRGWMLAFLINVVSFGYHRDIFFKQFAIVAEKLQS